MMRVTSASMFVTFRDGLNEALSNVQTYQAELSSGRRINAYSDDPVGAVSALRSRAEESDWDSYQRAADDARSWLGVADSTLQSMSTIVRRVKDLAVEATNASLPADARDAVAQEVTQLRDELVDLSNTQHLGRPVFGGFGQQAVSVAKNAAGEPVGWSYAGDGGTVLRQVSPTAQIEANVDGAHLLGFDNGAGQDLFSTLSRLVQDISAGNATGLAGGQAALDGHFTRVTESLGVVGARVNRVDAASELGTSTVQTLTTQRSNLEDADLAESVLHLQQAQASYQAALGAVARANLPSLADFLH